MEENSKYENFFDRLGAAYDYAEAEKAAKDSEERGKKLDYLIHKTFEGNEDGKELLKIWKETLIMHAGAEPGMDSVGIGIREGQKRFIRNILLTIKRVQEG